MLPYWRMVDAILGGVDALRHASGTVSVPGPQVPYENLRSLRSRGYYSIPESPYLPKFENESSADYLRRRLTAPLTNIYADVSDNLSAKPFAKELQLEEDAPDDLVDLAEDIDGQGNSMHVFAAEAFKKAIDKAIHWILVDYTRMPARATLADEREMNARPYWVHIPAERLLSVYSVFFAGKEHIVYARIYEPCTEREGFGEKHYRRVREFEREMFQDGYGKIIAIGTPSWRLWEEQEEAGGKKNWNVVDEGVLTVGIIPLVPCITGKRDGMTWRLCPPLRDLAHMQIEEFQQESNLKHSKEMTAFPVLVAEGVAQPKNADGDDIVVPVGPGVVLFAPPDAEGDHGTYKFLEPAATSLTFLQSDLERHRTEMRNLGKQPMATANLTVVTTANVSMKASSAVQAWAILFKDALEVAWEYTCLWMKRDDAPGVMIHTDFGIELAQDKELSELRELEKQGILAKEEVAIEFKRRGVLRDGFDWETNQEKRAGDEEGLEPEQPIDPVTGLPVQPLSPPGGGIPPSPGTRQTPAALSRQGGPRSVQ